MPFLLLLILEGSVRHAAHIAETWVDVTILESLVSVMQAVVLTPLTVAAYRIFLLGRQTVRADAVDDFPPGTAGILGLNLAFAVAVLPFSDMLTLMEHETAMMPGIALAYHGFLVVGMLAGALVTVRTGFLFVYAVLGRDLNISMAWRQTIGNGWRILALILLLQIPVAGLVAVLDGSTLSPLGAEIDFGAWQVWPGLIGQALGLVVLTILLAAASVFAYAHITGFALPREHAGGPLQHSLPFDVDPPSGASSGSA